MRLKVQWAGKVYAAVTENYANSKCSISGQRRARKALFSAFDAAWAGVSFDKISTLKNIQFFYNRSTKFTKIFDLIFKLKKLCHINMVEIKQLSIEMLIRTR